MRRGFLLFLACLLMGVPIVSGKERTKDREGWSVVHPAEAEVGQVRDASGRVWSTTGPGAAPWFGAYGLRWKVYHVLPDEPLYVRLRAEKTPDGRRYLGGLSIVVEIPTERGRWRRLKRFRGPHWRKPPARGEPTKRFLYVEPNGAERVRIRCYGQGCFVRVYQRTPPEKRRTAPDDATLREWVARLGDSSPEVRVRAHERLARVGEPARPYLEEGLRSRDAEVRFRARKLLARLDRPGPVVYEHELAPERRRLALSFLVALGEDPGRRRRLVRQLAHLGPPAVDDLVDLLDMPRPESRSAIYEALGRIRSRRAIQPCIDGLEDRSPRVRRAAHEALVDLTGKNLPRDDPEAWRQAFPGK